MMAERADEIAAESIGGDERVCCSDTFGCPGIEVVVTVAVGAPAARSGLGA